MQDIQEHVNVGSYCIHDYIIKVETLCTRTSMAEIPVSVGLIGMVNMSVL